MISSGESMTHMLDGEALADDENVHREQFVNVELPREESHDDVRGEVTKKVNKLSLMKKMRSSSVEESVLKFLLQGSEIV